MCQAQASAFYVCPKIQCISYPFLLKIKLSYIFNLQIQFTALTIKSTNPKLIEISMIYQNSFIRKIWWIRAKFSFRDIVLHQFHRGFSLVKLNSGRKD
jgi:hypothetical protein